ncbi:MAG: 50S ribosomal protein L22 [Omnitrophica bacterium GWA2_41_15]|nr:MAG: 50S ribosomal protein L22 [Omnitrophica bacterium GWA2_41_15]
MITKASAKYIRISTRKVRKVMDLIRGMPAVKADALLNNLSKRPCLYIKRVLKSAVDSADKRFHVPASSLYISLIKADQGPLIKRFRAASMGRATEILHRTTHIILELDKIKVHEKKAAIETEKAGKIKKVKVEDRESKTAGQREQTKDHKVKKENKKKEN